VPIPAARRPGAVTATVTAADPGRAPPGAVTAPEPFPPLLPCCHRTRRRPRRAPPLPPRLAPIPAARRPAQLPPLSVDSGRARCLALPPRTGAVPAKE